MGTITEQGRLALAELVSEQEKVTQRGVNRLEMVRSDFKRNFEQTVGANNRAEISLRDIQTAFEEANVQILAQQNASREAQLNKLSELDDAVRELAQTLQALDQDKATDAVQCTSRPDTGTNHGTSTGNTTVQGAANVPLDPDVIIADPPTNADWSVEEQRSLLRDLHAHQLEEEERYAKEGRVVGEPSQRFVGETSQQPVQARIRGESFVPHRASARRPDPGTIMRPPLEKLIEPFDGGQEKGDFSDFYKRICQAVEGQGLDDVGAKRECLNWFLRGQPRDALDAFRTDSNAAGKPPTLEDEVYYLKRMYDRKPVVTSQDVLNTYQNEREDFRNYYLRLRMIVNKCQEENFLGDENQKAATLQQLKAGVLEKYATVDFMNAKTLEDAMQAFEREEIHQERHSQSREAQERRAEEEAKRARAQNSPDDSDKRCVHSLTQDRDEEEPGSGGTVAMIGGIDPKRVYRIEEPPIQEEDIVPNYEHFCEYHNCPGHKTSECRQYTSRPGYYEALSGEPSQPPPRMAIPPPWRSGCPPRRGMPLMYPFHRGPYPNMGPRFPPPYHPAYWTGLGRGRPNYRYGNRGRRGRGHAQANRVCVTTKPREEPESESSTDTGDPSEQSRSSSLAELGALFPEETQGTSKVSTASHSGDTARQPTTVQPNGEQLLRSMEQVGRHAARVTGGLFIAAKDRTAATEPRTEGHDDDDDVPHEGCDWDKPPTRPVFWNTEVPKDTKEQGAPTLYVAPPEKDRNHPPRHEDQYLQSLLEERTEMDESEPKWLKPVDSLSYLCIRTVMMKPFDADLAQRREEATRVYDSYEKKELRKMEECMAEAERAPSEVPISFQVPFPHYVLYERQRILYRNTNVRWTRSGG